MMFEDIPEKQYFNEDELRSLVKDYKLSESDIKLISTDSYDESLITKRLFSLEEEDLKILYGCVLQTAIIGFGRRSGKRVLGEYMYKEKNIDIYSFYEKIGVEMNLTLKDNINPDQLTPRRLLRYFRYEIQEFIKNTGRYSYLFKKYSDRREEYKEYVFPGSEHLIIENDQANYLLDCYRKLDERNGSNISGRIIRVFEARGFLYNFELKQFK